MIRPPFAAGGLLRLRARATSDGQAPVHALRISARLSTRPLLVARFSEPEDVLPTSAIRRCTGTDRELLRSSCCEEK